MPLREIFQEVLKEDKDFIKKLLERLLQEFMEEEKDEQVGVASYARDKSVPHFPNFTSFYPFIRVIKNTFQTFKKSWWYYQNNYNYKKKHFKNVSFCNFFSFYVY